MPADDAAPLDLVRLFQEHREGLAGAVRGLLGGRAETQEILQEAFLRVWRAHERGRIEGDPLGYAFVVTLNLARDQRRRRASSAADVSLEQVGEMEPSAATASPIAGLEQQEAVAAARAAIGRLGDDEKDVFFLRVSAGQTFDAVAETLGIPIGTAKTRMRAALARLRTSLAPHAPVDTGRDSR